MLQKEAEERSKAEKRQKEIEQENISSAAPYLDKGIAAFRDRNYNEAIAYFSKAIEFYNKYYRAYSWRGAAYSAKRDFDKALSDYSKYAAIAPDNRSKSFANYQIARLYDEKEDFKLADNFFKIAIGFEFREKTQDEITDKSVILNAVAWFYATCKNKDYRDAQKAIKYATEACVITDWNNSGIIDTLAAAYAEAENFDDAVRMQKKALAIATSDKKDDYQKRLTMYLNKQKP